LAQLLNKNYAQAATTLKYVKQPDAMTDYLRAIVAARTGKASEAQTALQQAISKDPSLREYAEKDLELVNINK
jgi:Zn-dependent oligopeptidase